MPPSKSQKSKPKKIEILLKDATEPVEVRVEIMKQLLQGSDEEVDPIIASVLDAAAVGDVDAVCDEKLRELDEKLRELQQGPLRGALFDRMLDQPGLERRAQVVLPEGTLGSPMVSDEGLVEKMGCGDPVWMDAKGSVILHHARSASEVGEEAELERVLEGGYVEVSVGQMGRSVFRVSARLAEQLESGEAEAGSTLVVCSRRMFAFRALPKDDALAYMKYLCREPVPNVVVERDIGAPPAFIEQLLTHLRREFESPEISKRYRLRRSKLNLLSGIPGSGKTFGILGLWNAMYEIMSQFTGVPVEALPPRVMRLRASDVLSKYVGSSDKAVARFFKEADELASQPFIDEEGRSWQLPLLIIAEEIDALARERGHDGIHDRIMASVLEGLDPGREIYRDQLVFLVATTNTSHLVDSAVIRRIGGRIETFGHLDRFTFRSVMEKHLRDLPFAGATGQTAEEARRQAVCDLSGWLFGPNSALGGQVEVTLVGQANPQTHYARDFLTAGLIDRAAQVACEEAANAEHGGNEFVGLTTAGLSSALERQVRQIVDLLTPQNCGQYLSLPDGERAAVVRRLDQPAANPFELERAS